MLSEQEVAELPRLFSLAVIGDNPHYLQAYKLFDRIEAHKAMAFVMCFRNTAFNTHALLRRKGYTPRAAFIDLLSRKIHAHEELQKHCTYLYYPPTVEQLETAFSNIAKSYKNVDRYLFIDTLQDFHLLFPKESADSLERIEQLAKIYRCKTIYMVEKSKLSPDLSKKLFSIVDKVIEADHHQIKPEIHVHQLD